MADVRRQFESYVFGPARLTQLVLPEIRAQGWGKVINLKSMGGKLTFPGGSWYHATKHAIETVVETVIETVIEKAINASRPKARCRVTPSAHFPMTQRAITPDRIWDTFMASQFPKPGAKS